MFGNFSSLSVENFTHDDQKCFMPAQKVYNRTKKSLTYTSIISTYNIISLKKCTYISIIYKYIYIYI